MQASSSKSNLVLHLHTYYMFSIINIKDILKRHRECDAEVLDLKTFYYNDTEDIDEVKLEDNVTSFNPDLVVISICYSQVSKVKFILEKPGVLAKIRLNRNLVLSTNGKVIDLDEKQVNLIYEVANPNNTSKNVVIQGPEGSGKTLLGIEIVKVLVSNYVYTNNLTPQQVKSHIRVIFSACYKSYNDPEEVALWKKQIESIVNRDHVNSLYEDLRLRLYQLQRECDKTPMNTMVILILF